MFSIHICGFYQSGYKTIIYSLGLFFLSRAALHYLSDPPFPISAVINPFPSYRQLYINSIGPTTLNTRSFPFPSTLHSSIFLPPTGYLQSSIFRPPPSIDALALQAKLVLYQLPLPPS